MNVVTLTSLLLLTACLCGIYAQQNASDSTMTTGAAASSGSSETSSSSSPTTPSAPTGASSPSSTSPTQNVSTTGGSMRPFTQIFCLMLPSFTIAGLF
ncbi:unnamed protein product [Fasciola hepatica]|uniref:Uncharacterized protein n=2 Tax=Fasciola hepatica TaxID=6192 RepID=A0A4E0RKK3_FASHE|nr:hypothetical protein D915_007936 [Fasciola hepatica]CAK6928102.1 unnamed protein product [Fasciola hepatica]